MQRACAALLVTGACRPPSPRQVAIAVYRHAKEKNIARVLPGRGETIESFVKRKMYYPEYAPLIK